MSSVLTTEQIDELLKTPKTVAIVGISQKEERDSFKVAKYMQAAGFKIIPINPVYDEVLGEKSFKDLSSVAEKIDIVNIFRKPEAIPPIVDEAIKVKAGVVWMQLGISNDEAALKANAAGVKVVMDKCIKIEHARL